jgi:2,3-bisphosphoglycerate-independent phosphoglycerate mutase
MDHNVTQRRLLKRTKSVTIVARLSSEQIRVRPVRERLRQMHALICQGVVLLDGVAIAEGMSLH